MTVLYTRIALRALKASYSDEGEGGVAQWIVKKKHNFSWTPWMYEGQEQGQQERVTFKMLELWTFFQLYKIPKNLHIFVMQSSNWTMEGKKEIGSIEMSLFSKSHR